MDHPLTEGMNKDLRQRVIKLLREDYLVQCSRSFIFVCGGNSPNDMRSKFRSFCQQNHPEMEIFFPEFAMKSYFSALGVGQFDIGDFEELVAELSHAVVIFPEAAGSYAEIGYFSKIEKLASKTILIMDSKWQATDSFISLGPAKKIDTFSVFRPSLQTPYDTPSFNDVIQRINRYKISDRKKALRFGKFSDLDSFELFCLIHKCVQLLSVATMADLMFLLRGIFSAKLSENRIKQITSILVGAEYLREIGGFGHFCVRTKSDRKELLSVRDGRKNAEAEIRLELASLYVNGDTEFRTLVRSVGNAP